MARLRFRVATIHLDEEEEVSSIWAVVHDDTLPVIENMIGAVERVGGPRRGGTEICIHLPAEQIRDLFGHAGKRAPVDAGYKHTREIYDSLSFIVYGMMDRD